MNIAISNGSLFRAVSKGIRRKSANAAFLIGVSALLVLAIISTQAEAQVFKSRDYTFEGSALGNIPTSGVIDQEPSGSIALPGSTTLTWYDFSVVTGQTDDTGLTNVQGQATQTFLSNFGQTASGMTPFSTTRLPVSVVSTSPDLNNTSDRALEFNGQLGRALRNQSGMRGIVLNNDAVTNNQSLLQATFDGDGNGLSETNDVVSRSDFSTLIQAWVRPDTNTNQTIWTIGPQHGRMAIRNGEWEVLSLGPAGSGNGNSIVSDVAVQAGEWTHLAVLRTGAGASLFINGTLEAFGSGFFDNLNWPNLYSLGGHTNGTDNFTGQIDDFSLAGLPNGIFNQSADLDYFGDLGINFTGILGDVVQDGVVDQLDYNEWSKNVGFDNRLGNGDPNTLLLGDTNSDGRVNLTDFNIIQREARAGGNLIQFNVVPEPTTLALLLPAAVLMLTSRRQRSARRSHKVSRRPALSVTNRARQPFQRSFTILVAVSVLAGNFAAEAFGELLVAEDFRYRQQTDSELDSAGLGTQFAGGQNGPAGFFDSDWAGVGSAIIISEDFRDPDGAGPEDGTLIAPFTSNLEAGMTQQFFSGGGNYLTRDYDFGPSVGSNQTLYFAARVKAETEGSYPRIPGDPSPADPIDREGPISARVSIVSSRDPVSGVTAAADSLVSFGLSGSSGAATGRVFANLGPVPTGSGLPDAQTADTAISVGSYHLIVGKLEINAAGGSAANPADFNASGKVDGGDFLVWQRNFGRMNSPPNTAGNFNSDANIDAIDLQGWSDNYGANSPDTNEERLTVWINPVGSEASNAPALVVEEDVFQNWNDPSIASFITLFTGPDTDGTSPKRPHYYDDVAIGTVWEDVQTVDVPRLTLDVNTSTGEVRILNQTSETFDISAYEVLSESASLDFSNWNSLADQGESGWVVNNPTNNDPGSPTQPNNDLLNKQLVESNFAPGGVKTIGPSDVISLGPAFDTSGTQDLVARWQVLQGNDGLLNIFEINYHSETPSAGVVPEPSSVILLVLSGCALGLLRRKV